MSGERTRRLAKHPARSRAIRNHVPRHPLIPVLGSSLRLARAQATTLPALLRSFPRKRESEQQGWGCCGRITDSQPLVPAKAGTQGRNVTPKFLDPRFRGDEREDMTCRLATRSARSRAIRNHVHRHPLIPVLESSLRLARAQAPAGIQQQGWGCCGRRMG